jgi:hypothetical protein
MEPALPTKSIETVDISNARLYFSMSNTQDPFNTKKSLQTDAMNDTQSIC